MRRPDVPIRVRKRIVDVESSPNMKPVVAIRAPDQETAQRSLVKAPKRIAAHSSYLFCFKYYGGDPPVPPTATPLSGIYKQAKARCANPSPKTDG